MKFLYNLTLYSIQILLPVVALFSKKINLFVNGRLQVWKLIQKIPQNQPVIWFHAASLGEYEQGLPVMEAFKKQYPNHFIVLTFFSPSGYEIRKNNTVAHLTLYLPLDTPNQAKKFVESLNPQKVFFIKYEFWLNYLKVLQQKQVETYLISGIFRENQLFFKSYGGFYRKALQAFTHFFVQNRDSEKLLNQLNYYNVTVSGDTRFDRVYHIAQQYQPIPAVQTFVNQIFTIVIGSSWEADENIWLDYINSSKLDIKYIIAPHNINHQAIDRFQKQLRVQSVLYSDNLFNPNAKVLIINSIGILNKLYAEASIAYVGGGFGKSGVHNLLEPAVYGVPLIIGPNYDKFAEAKALVNQGSCLPITHLEQLSQIIENWYHNPAIRTTLGNANRQFVLDNVPVTEKITQYFNF